MLGLLAIYFIGRNFYQLAHEYNRSRWGFGILGVVFYYASYFLWIFILGFLCAIVDFQLTDTSSLLLTLIALGLALLSIWGIYKLMEKTWKNAPLASDSSLLDDSLNDLH